MTKTFAKWILWRWLRTYPAAAAAHNLCGPWDLFPCRSLAGGGRPAATAAVALLMVDWWCLVRLRYALVTTTIWRPSAVVTRYDRSTTHDEKLTCSSFRQSSNCKRVMWNVLKSIRMKTRMACCLFITCWCRSEMQRCCREAITPLAKVTYLRCVQAVSINHSVGYY